MLKKTVTYDDLDGNPVTEDFYFHLNKLEIAELDIKTPGGLMAFGERLQKTNDAMEAYEVFKDLLLTAYGVRSGDRHFMKKDSHGVPYRDYLEGSDALGEIIIEMLQNAELGAKFFEDVLPAAWLQEVQKARASEEAGTKEEAPVAPRPAPRRPQDRQPKKLPAPKEVDEVPLPDPGTAFPAEFNSREEYDAFLAWKQEKAGFNG